jgi:hypothetical protein
MIRDRKDVFTTATGRVLYVLEPDPSQICIEDIARSASRVCRYNGHLKAECEFYSVAQHAVLVSHECFTVNALIGLMHDAAEAYTHDIITAWKVAMGDSFRVIERAWISAVDEAFGFGGRLLHLPADVKHADNILLAQERRELCVRTEIDDWAFELARESDAPIVPMLPFAAYRFFMARYRELVPEARERILTPSTLGALVTEVP